MSIHGECFDRGISENCNVTCSIFEWGKCKEDWEEILINSHDDDWIDDEEFLDYIDMYS